VIKKKVDGTVMYLSEKRTGLSGHLWGTGVHEPAFMWLLRKRSKGDIALDIGANIGYSTLSLCKNMKKVIAIEPDKRSRKILKKNIKMHKYTDKVDVLSTAMSNVKGKRKFYLAKHPNVSAFTPCKKHWVKEKNVLTDTVDSLGVLPNFIKMDLEGHEIEVIEGGMKSLSETPFCRILLEVHPQFYNEERSFEKTIRSLIQIGFSIKYLISAGMGCPQAFADRGYKPFKQFKDDSYSRGIFEGVDQEDAINFSCYQHHEYIKEKDSWTKKIVRAIMLEKK
jgi:FkbM family methyltransferase